MNRRQQGIALITTLLILLLTSTMIAGIAWLVMGDQKLGGNNGDRQLAFYGAESGLEALTAQLENTFNTNYAPTASDINTVISNTPMTMVPNVKYLALGSTTNGSGYTIDFVHDPNGNPASTYHTIASGAYAGLVGLTTPYTLSAIAHTTSGSEVKLVRSVQTVAIPIFQFGIFSDTDLSFFAGPDFDFGGRVHTNGNLWLAEGNGATLTMDSKVTAVGEIITSNLENGWPTSNAYNGAVNITTTGSAGSYADLTAQTPFQSATGTSNWVGNVGAFNGSFTSMAGGIYSNNVAVGPENNGVTALNMAIATPAIGGQTIDIIRRAVKNEDTGNPGKLAERYYSQVSLRILLSDYGPSRGCTDSDVSSTSGNLPNLAANDATPTPVDLAKLAWDTSAPAGVGNKAAPAWLTNVGTATFPLPVSYASTGVYAPAPGNGYWIKQYYPVITGCIKIDMQSDASPGTWTDVTKEILKLGYTGRNIDPQVGNPGTTGIPAWVGPPALPPNLPTKQVNASTCADPSLNAVIRLARLRDNPATALVGNGWCGAPPTTTANQHGTDYWPNAIFDTREGLLRDDDPGDSTITLAGTMYYVELDVNNLAKWFKGTIGASGTSANNTTGYSVYFSDRRGEQKDSNPPASVGAGLMQTGAYGYEDFVNPLSARSCPNGTLDVGEDVESDYLNGVAQNSPALPRTYGGTPQFDPFFTNAGLPITTLNVAGALANHWYCTGPGTAFPFARFDSAEEARENPAVLFRRALKVVNGSTFSTGQTCNGAPCGLTIVAENPVYVQGDFNNPGLSTSFTGAGVAASVIADSFTFLSDGWNDTNSFAFPYNLNNRNASDTTYRLAIVAGKNIPFHQPSVGTVGQDFGTDGGAHNFLRYLENWGGNNLWYDGSIVSMYFNHQAVGTFKCCNTVYSPPNRNYTFDTNFLTPSLLPPLTPMLRALNTLTFTQDMLPTQ